MDRIFNVFVSSTFKDLEEERSAIFDTLLRINCFPTGMEQFPATDEEQLKVIGALIEHCDFYVLVIGGRYGSETAAGKSFTETEYDFAIENGIPVYAFVHSNPTTMPDNDSMNLSKWAKLLNFRNRVQACGKMNAEFESKSELLVKVMQSITSAIQTTSRPGWVRGDKLVSDSAAREILELRNEVVFLKSLLGLDHDNDTFASGEEKVVTRIKVKHGRNVQFAKYEVTWNAAFDILADPLFDGSAPDDFAREFAKGYLKAFPEEHPDPKNPRFSQIEQSDFKPIIMQLNALGLIQRNLDGKWTLTEVGESQYYRLRAKRAAMDEKKPDVE